MKILQQAALSTVTLCPVPKSTNFTEEALSLSLNRPPPPSAGHEPSHWRSHYSPLPATTTSISVAAATQRTPRGDRSSYCLRQQFQQLATPDFSKRARLLASMSEIQEKIASEQGLLIPINRV
ncbi:hypothetical protein KQX54_000467 [Cotesia glomerata]|uniref:Uncharacterized protein n=1 Tax=Cotesia glomerata TaxID=32391 RepID=A0AAV7HRT4_COTGL|nr:hypothetical protein KQX54_000467 [Cotesia glomerata]